ncbi:right-handed parallel beta-helix repeat-containing protein [Dokdonella fugitiva]|nr:right-handed parallel beta-helix repeat-containing protein [Dokdonella fugitiva]
MSSLLCACMLALPVVAVGATRKVPSQYGGIQQAIDAASNGDIVLVAAGTYYEQLVIDGLDIALVSEGGPSVTTIDATYLDAAVTIRNGTRATIVQGFRLTRGRSQSGGGGILVMGGSASIVGNRIEGNLGSGSGNGVVLQNSDALVYGNVITGNAGDGIASGGGGGGGIGVLGARQDCGNCRAEIRANLIAGNSVDRLTWGGGILLMSTGPIIVVGNLISGNTAPTAGAGIAMINAVDARIEGNLIVDNEVLQADGMGGGIYGGWSPSIVGNTLVDNVANHGSSIYGSGYVATARIANNIAVSADHASAIECAEGHPSPVIANNDVYAPAGTAYAGVCTSVTGTAGNISADPNFAGPGNFRLTSASPAIDAGQDALVGEAFDFDGRTRIVDGNGDATAVVDMGAFEFTGDAVFADGFDPRGPAASP